MSVHTYVNFDGNCREALDFYRQVFGRTYFHGKMVKGSSAIGEISYISLSNAHAKIYLRTEFRFICLDKKKGRRKRFDRENEPK